MSWHTRQAWDPDHDWDRIQQILERPYGPEGLERLLRKANQQTALGRPGVAIRILRKTQSTWPETSSIALYCSLAVALTRTGNHGEAIASWLAAAKLEEQAEKVSFDLAIVQAGRAICRHQVLDHAEEVLLLAQRAVESRRLKGYNTRIVQALEELVSRPEP